MSEVRSYRDLIVWQKAMQLAKHIYEYTRSFPREEMYGMTGQIRRAVVSVAANIAEGHARSTKGEYRQFIGIARGSLAEVETLVLLAIELGYGDPVIAKAILEGCSEVSRLQAGLLKSLC